MKCGDSEWEELQSSVKLDKGEFEFSDLTLKQEYAGQDCQLKVAGKIGGEEVESTFAIKAAPLSIPEIEVEPPSADACDSYPCVSISETARVGELFAITYSTKDKVSENTNITFYLEDENGTKLLDALWHYDDTDTANPTLSKQASAVLSTGQNSLSIKVFTTAGTAAKGKIIAEVSGQVANQKIVVESDGTLAAHNNALTLDDAYLFSAVSPANLRLKINNTQDVAAQVFTTRNDKVHYIGATAFSSSISTPVLSNDKLPILFDGDKVIVVAADGRVAQRGVQVMQLNLQPSVITSTNQGRGFSVTTTHQNCVSQKTASGIYITPILTFQKYCEVVVLHATRDVYCG